MALQKGDQRLTRDHLETQALSVAQCEQMHAETMEGESQLNESSQAVVRLRERLGLNNWAPAKATPPQPSSTCRRRRPGQRLPTRDAIGQTNTASL
jgi:hypothetical protein